jgi:hypothetical protein
VSQEPFLAFLRDAPARGLPGEGFARSLTTEPAARITRRAALRSTTFLIDIAAIRNRRNSLETHDDDTF